MALRLCEVCRSKPAIGRCRICGRFACSEDLEEGICRLCRDTLCSVCGERLAVASCEVCGRLVCDECGIQVTPVVWLCPDCAARFKGKWPPQGIIEHEIRRLSARLEKILPLVVPRNEGVKAARLSRSNS